MCWWGLSNKPFLQKPVLAWGRSRLGLLHRVTAGAWCVWQPSLSSSCLYTPMHKLDVSHPSTAFVHPALHHLSPRRKSPNEIPSLAQSQWEHAPLPQQQQQKASGCSPGCVGLSAPHTATNVVAAWAAERLGKRARKSSKLCYPRRG